MISLSADRKSTAAGFGSGCLISGGDQPPRPVALTLVELADVENVSSSPPGARLSRWSLALAVREVDETWPLVVIIYDCVTPSHQMTMELIPRIECLLARAAFEAANGWCLRCGLACWNWHAGACGLTWSAVVGGDCCILVGRPLPCSWPFSIRIVVA